MYISYHGYPWWSNFRIFSDNEFYVI